MKILLTNDDGIHAPGISALHHALLGVDERHNTPIGGPDTTILTVAPDTVQSATSHGVTFHAPIMTRPVAVDEHMRGVAVDGRPADCVKVALSSIWGEHFGEGSRPDLVISGMNAGANVGLNVIYSGTVAAALEAAFLGVPAIAVSMHLGRGKPLFEVAAAHARRAIELVLAAGLLGAHDCININVPRTEVSWGPDDPGERARPAVREPSDPDPDSVDPYADPEIRVCPMNTHGLVDRYERRESPSGDVYYWASGGGLDFHRLDDGTDVAELFERRTVVTPLEYDLTRRDTVGPWREAIEGSAARRG